MEEMSQETESKSSVKKAGLHDLLSRAILNRDPDKSPKKLTEPTDSDLPMKEDPKYTKYFRMMKMVSPFLDFSLKIQHYVLDSTSDINVSTLGDFLSRECQWVPLKTRSKEMGPKPKVRRKKVYWNKVDVKERNVWSEVRRLNLQVQLETEEFEGLFSQLIDAEEEKKKKDAKEASSKKPAKTVKVIDSKRGFNGDIILKKIKVAPEEVASMIDSMDCGSLDPTALKSLYEFMPTDEERKGLADYLENCKCPRDEAVADLTPCEKFMVAMTALSDGDKKFHGMIFLAEFQSKITELKSNVDHVVTACDELQTSKRFKALLAIILKLVNRINNGSGGGAIVDGFTLDSLSKLSETKAFDNKTTVLQYLVRVILVLAKGITIESLLASTKQLCDDSKIVEETAATDGEGFRKSLSSTSKWEFSVVKAQQSSVKKLQNIASFLQKEDVPIGTVNTTHFERFALFAKLELQQALEDIKEAEKEYISTLEFFGEDKKTQASDFFCMIDAFMKAFDKAVVQVEQAQEAKLKEARRALAKEAKFKARKAVKTVNTLNDINKMTNALKEKSKNKPSSKRRWPASNKLSDAEKGRACKNSNEVDGPSLLAAISAAARKKKATDTSDSTSSDEKGSAAQKDSRSVENELMDWLTKIELKKPMPSKKMKENALSPHVSSS
ncbi:hypothetical protein ACHAXR_008805 [Thalassiosira sp. AJA248-18]